MRIFTLIKGLLYRLNLIANYVVEWGIEGAWVYQKWANGIAECWCETTITTPVQNTLGYTYYAPDVTVNFPSGLFIKTPIMNISGGGNYGVDLWTITSKTKDSVKVRVTYPVTHGSNGWETDIIVKGWWK